MRESPEIPATYESSGARDEILNYVLRSGAQAPSFYNCQPWLFRVTDEQAIDVILDKQADSSFYNWNDNLSTMACGAVIENMRIALEGRGLAHTIETFPEGEDSSVLARITLGQSTQMHEIGAIHSLESAIWRRHTNTLEFNSDPLTDAQKKRLFDSLESASGIKLYLLEKESEKHKAFLAASCAEQVRFARKDLHRHLHSLIRWTEVDAETDKTGLTLPSMGACGIGETFFRITRTWPVMKVMNLFGAYKSQASRACMGLLHCSAVGLLSVKQGGKTGLLEAGRQMQRLWLTTTALGLDLQPHTSLTLFNWAWHSGGAGLYTPWEQRILRKAFQLYCEAFPEITDNASESGIFLFRVGQGPAVRGYTLRKDVSQLMLKASV